MGQNGENLPNLNGGGAALPNANNDPPPAAMTELQRRLQNLVFDQNFLTRPIDPKDHSFKYVNFSTIDVLVGYVDSKIETNRYFKYDYDYHSVSEYNMFVAILYNHIVTAIHTMRIMRREGTLNRRDSAFLERFLEIYPETTIPVDGAVFMFLKTIQAAEPQDQQRFSTVIPTLNLPSRANPLRADRHHLIRDTLQYTQTDWIGLMRVLLSLAKPVDYTNSTYNLISNNDIPNPIDIPIHASAAGTNRRTQQLCLRPGFTFKNETVPAGNAQRWREAMRHMVQHLRVPKIDLTNNIESLEQAIGFDLDPLFFGRIRAFLTRRLSFCEEVTTLNRVPIGRSSHILFDVKVNELTTIPNYQRWFTEERDIPAAMIAVAGWPTQGAPPNVLPVNRGSYEFMIQTVPAVGNNTIPIVDLASHLFDNFSFLYAHEAQAFTSEMGLNEEHGQAALALRTYTKSIVPPIWRPDTEEVSIQSGPYFANTNHQWRRTPVLSTSPNVLNVLDMSYRTGRGNPPFPLDRP
jgi:hypothetical protein